MLPRLESYIVVTSKEPGQVIAGNGHGKWTIDISHWPWYAQYSWAIGAKFGMLALLALAGAGLYGWWQYKVSLPEAETRISVLKSQLDTNRRILDCMDKIVESETKTLAWQMEWKSYISEQHALRASEAKLLIGHHEKAELFYERTDKLHGDQLELLKGILDELRYMVGARKDEGSPKNPLTPPRGGDSKG